MIGHDDEGIEKKGQLFLCEIESINCFSCMTRFKEEGMLSFNVRCDEHGKLVLDGVSLGHWEMLKGRAKHRALISG